VVTAVIISILLFVTMRQVTKQAVQATQDALLSTAVSSILQQTRSRDSNVDIDLPYDIFTMLGAISQDKVYYRVDLDGVFLTGYEDLAPLMDGPLSDRPLLTSQSFKGEHVRQATIMQSFLIDGQAKILRVTVAQTQLFQEAILREISRNASIIGLSFFGRAQPQSCLEPFWL
jgi:two-component system sensor histidine kinase TctE